MRAAPTLAFFLHTELSCAKPGRSPPTPVQVRDSRGERCQGPVGRDAKICRGRPRGAERSLRASEAREPKPELAQV
jgi:hypothetical protein